MSGANTQCFTESSLVRGSHLINTAATQLQTTLPSAGTETSAPAWKALPRAESSGREPCAWAGGVLPAWTQAGPQP